MQKDPHDPDNHDGVITHLEPVILECEVKWALGSITTNKASGGDGIPVELFQILRDNAVKMLHSICRQIWKTQKWPQDWKSSVFILIPKKWSEVTQSCPTICNPMDCKLQGSSLHGILQARILEWVAISFSRGSSLPRDRTHISFSAGGFFTAELRWKPSWSTIGFSCYVYWRRHSPHIFLIGTAWLCLWDPLPQMHLKKKKGPLQGTMTLYTLQRFFYIGP